MTSYETRLIEAARRYRAAVAWATKCEAAADAEEEAGARRLSELQEIARDAVGAMARALRDIKEAAKESDL